MQGDHRKYVICAEYLRVSQRFLLSYQLDKIDKIMSMFVLVSRLLLATLEAWLFFENWGTNFTPELSNRMFLANFSNT